MSLEQGWCGGLGAEWEGAWPALPWLSPASLPTVMSEAGSETLEDEWQSISEIASTCNTILESLSREGEATRVLRGEGVGIRGAGARVGLSPFTCPDGPSVPTGQPILESGDAKGTPKSDAE